ncbi:MAG: MFS transporter [Clostridia bacterium]|nr:MFS transporter [Clostridia bacterium]
MWKSQVQAFMLSFTDIFNTRDDDAKGRVINLGCTLLAAFYNVFITGIFYTGFLSMYGISITGAGIVTFIPYIANIFTIFSSRVLSRFRKRKPILVASKIFFYFMYIVATTIMPQLVQDPGARLVWFCIILFIGYAVYAPFSPGFTVWFYRFYPAENHRRTRYIQLCQIFSSIMSTIILLFSGLLTDAVAGSPMQDQLIIWFRYGAFVLVVVETMIQLRAKEYPAADDSGLKLKEVFTLPFKYRKFLLCMAFMFTWNYVGNLNNGLWSYHLLNHMNFSYTLINAMSVAYTVILLMTSGIWGKVLRRYSWIKTFGIACLIFVPTEFFFFMMTTGSSWIYVPNSLIQNLCSVGLNLAYANILYMNLPEENSTAHIAFYTIGCNVFAFLGLLTGTAVSSITGDSTIPFLGMDVYAVQFTTLMRGVALFTIGMILVKKWRLFTRDEDIEEIERDTEARRNMAKLRGPVDMKYVMAQVKQKALSIRHRA